uniref:Xylulose kinase-1 n=1 Tax=Tanacetum cinerariifolium TaxID=118510 RepID=A0A6L2KNJ4_TANCI|nr:hypothetical protein [Tanacetum cinerariifolium]
MVTYLSKSDASAGFDQIIDFLNAQVIEYALLVNPTIYVSCIKQFWATASIKKVTDFVKFQALIDRKKLVVTEDIIRRDLRLDDADGVDCLPTEGIFAELARMGYEKPPLKLTFYKAFFSTQWKFLIHTLVQCMSAKRTAWNKFSCFMASAVICLATCRKFNFSKYIFDSMCMISLLTQQSVHPLENTKPDVDDVIWKLQRYMHYPIMWKLHSNCGVHQVSSTTRRHDIYMLAEKDYPLSNEVMALMLSTRLHVEEDSEMARDLVMKIFMNANQQRVRVWIYHPSDQEA